MSESNKVTWKGKKKTKALVIKSNGERAEISFGGVGGEERKSSGRGREIVGEKCRLNESSVSVYH